MKQSAEKSPILQQSCWAVSGEEQQMALQSHKHTLTNHNFIPETKKNKTKQNKEKKRPYINSTKHFYVFYGFFLRFHDSTEAFIEFISSFENLTTHTYIHTLQHFLRRPVLHQCVMFRGGLVMINYSNVIALRSRCLGIPLVKQRTESGLSGTVLNHTLLFPALITHYSVTAV